MPGGPLRWDTFPWGSGLWEVHPPLVIMGPSQRDEGMQQTLECPTAPQKPQQGPSLLAWKLRLVNPLRKEDQKLC